MYVFLLYFHFLSLIWTNQISHRDFMFRSEKSEENKSLSTQILDWKTFQSTRIDESNEYKLWQNTCIYHLILFLAHNFLFSFCRRIILSIGYILHQQQTPEHSWQQQQKFWCVQEFYHTIHSSVCVCVFVSSIQSPVTNTKAILHNLIIIVIIIILISGKFNQ